MGDFVRGFWVFFENVISSLYKTAELLSGVMKYDLAAVLLFCWQGMMLGQKDLTFHFPADLSGSVQLSFPLE